MTLLIIPHLSPVSIQTQLLALRALNFTQQTQAPANRNARSKTVATMIGCLSTQALAFLAVFVYATHATQAIAFEWKPGFTHRKREIERERRKHTGRNSKQSDDAVKDAT